MIPEPQDSIAFRLAEAEGWQVLDWRDRAQADTRPDR
jgi:hypothetical protein